MFWALFGRFRQQSRQRAVFGCRLSGAKDRVAVVSITGGLSSACRPGRQGEAAWFRAREPAACMIAEQHRPAPTILRCCNYTSTYGRPRLRAAQTLPSAPSALHLVGRLSGASVLSVRVRPHCRSPERIPGSVVRPLGRAFLQGRARLLRPTPDVIGRHVRDLTDGASVAVPTHRRDH
jgi:hypothetical protein